MTSIYVRCEEKGALLDKLRRKPRVHVPAVREAQERIADFAADQMRKRATQATGKLMASIKPKTKAKGLFTGVTFNPVGTGGVRKSRADPKGFRSGWALNSSDRYHPRGSGQTKGWIDDARTAAEQYAPTQLEAAAREVEKAWQQ